jgi:L-alanine-DL-glutamate epimerase-like enolase superfamily enzyme
MKIARIDTLQVSGGWDPWSYLKITTDEGLVGWSEYNEARGRRGLTPVLRGLAELVLGEDPRNVNTITAKLYNLTVSTAGGLQALAIGAIENACLDLKAKALGVPCYELFRGALRKRLPLYWSHCGLYRARHQDFFEKTIGKPAVRSLDDIKALGREVAEAGYGALKTNLLALDPQLLKGGAPYVARGVGVAELNINDRLVGMVVDQLSAFREGAGPGVKLMMDLNYNYKSEGFRQIAKAVEPFNMMWLEMDTWEPQALAAIRAFASTPIASLEAVLGRRALRPYLDAQAVDVAIVDVVFNGALEALKMAALIDAYEVNVAAHNSHGPLGSLMCAHYCAAIPNFRVLEYDADEAPWRQQLLTHPHEVENGEFIVPDRPGWGADIVEEVVRAHPVKGH